MRSIDPRALTVHLPPAIRVKFQPCEWWPRVARTCRDFEAKSSGIDLECLVHFDPVPFARPFSKLCTRCPPKRISLRGTQVPDWPRPNPSNPCVAQ